MSQREEGYQQALADAERVCAMIAAYWKEKAAAGSPEQFKVASLISDTLTLAGRSIRSMEPGFVSSKSG